MPPHEIHISAILYWSSFSVRELRVRLQREHSVSVSQKLIRTRVDKYVRCSQFTHQKCTGSSCTLARMRGLFCNARVFSNATDVCLLQLVYGGLSSLWQLDQ
jgi:hypothetical protein